MNKDIFKMNVYKYNKESYIVHYTFLLITRYNIFIQILLDIRYYSLLLAVIEFMSFIQLKRYLERYLWISLQKHTNFFSQNKKQFTTF